jgi:hypothetical protein
MLTFLIIIAKLSLRFINKESWGEILCDFGSSKELSAYFFLENEKLKHSRFQGLLKNPMPECTPPLAGCGFNRKLSDGSATSSGFQRKRESPAGRDLRFPPTSFCTPKPLFQHALQPAKKSNLKTS